jgi:hypothetical protein
MSSPPSGFCDIPGQRSAEGRDVPSEADRDVAQRPAGGRSQRRHPRHAICQGDDIFGDLVPIGRPRIEPRFSAAADHIGERLGERDSVLDAGIHALPAGGAMHMGGVSAEQNVPFARALRNTMVNLEAGASDAVVDAKGL